MTGRPQAGAEQPVSTASLLEASRRLDWRFLFPEVALGRVGCLGPPMAAEPDDALREALRLFSAEFQSIDALPEGLGQPEYTLIVARQLDPGYVPALAGLLGPGSFLYVELQRTFRPTLPLRRPTQSPHDWVAGLEHAGFRDVEAHWFWPDFFTCLEIVPLADRGALLLSLSRRRGAWSSRIKAVLAGWLVRLGFFPSIAPCVGIVARWPKGSATR